MSLETLFLMRHEMILLGIILVLLIGEIFKSNNSRHLMTNAALVLFGIHTVVGFLPLADALLAWNLSAGLWIITSLIFSKRICITIIFGMVLRSGTLKESLALT